MKLRFLIYIVILAMPFKVLAQNDITLEEIWKNYTFGSKTVSGINSMKDGEHYSTLINSGSNQYIVKYNYKTGNAIDTIYNRFHLFFRNH